MTIRHNYPNDGDEDQKHPPLPPPPQSSSSFRLKPTPIFFLPFLLLILILLLYMLRFPSKSYFLSLHFHALNQPQFHSLTLNSPTPEALSYALKMVLSKPQLMPPDHASSSKYYFSVVHSDTNIIIWSANRKTPMSSSDKLSLTVSGLIVTNQAGQPLWSTPQFNSDISAMQLSETGNLVLVDAGNNTL